MDGIKLNTNNLQEPGKIKTKGTVTKGIVLDENHLPDNQPKGEKLALTRLNKSKKPANVINLSESEKVLDKEAVSQVTKLTVAATSKKILTAGLIGVPLDAAFNSFKYHSGEIDAKQYTGKTAGGFVNWSVFEAGNLGAVAVASAVIGRKLGPLGGMVIGVGTGLLTASIYHKTVGHHVDDGLSKIIPESIAKPFAGAMDKYFAKPVDKYILTPIKENPKTAIAVGAVVATALTIKYPVGFGLNFLVGTAGATGINVGGNMVYDKIFPQPVILKLPSIDIPPTKAEMEWAAPLEEKFNKDNNSVSDIDHAKYLNILQRYEHMKEIKK